ncbi:MAG: hypothetical protein MI864_00375 [Pseudomonadales bacterium]|nr:hypothetical protein [Pseudomonadales bacterium]
MSKAFVERFITTKDDGHDFFPYGDAPPTFEEVKEHMESVMHDVFRHHKRDAPKETVAMISAMENKWNGDQEYREQCIRDAAEYIMDID